MQGILRWLVPEGTKENAKKYFITPQKFKKSIDKCWSYSLGVT
jgi:hypothetical protein